VGALPGDPLAAFLPHALPRGVSFLCASRPRHPYVSSLEARDGDFVQLDLDGSDSAADNDATVRMFWESVAGPLGLDARFVDEAVARAGGNVQHAVQLRRQVAATPAHLRRVEDIPRGLGALIERTWERIAHDAVVVEGLGILCAAREALSLDELTAVAGWSGDAPRRAFLRGARELLVETSRLDGTSEFRLHHDSIRAHVANYPANLPAEAYGFEDLRFWTSSRSRSTRLSRARWGEGEGTWLRSQRARWSRSPSGSVTGMCGGIDAVGRRYFFAS